MSDLHARVMRMLEDRASQGGGIMAGKRGKCPVYVDNAENRRLGRVGKKKGSKPVSSKKKAPAKKAPAKKSAPKKSAPKKKGGIRAGGNDWVNYVKKYARMNGLTYGDAMRQAGPSYHAQG